MAKRDYAKDQQSVKTLRNLVKDLQNDVEGVDHSFNDVFSTVTDISKGLGNSLKFSEENVKKSNDLAKTAAKVAVHIKDQNFFTKNLLKLELVKLKLK